MCWVVLIEGGVQCSMFLFPHGLHFLTSLCHARCNLVGAYTYYVRLDIKWHLFDQSPSCKQGVSEAIFGFGQADNKVISKGIVFPLFVRDPARRTRKFTYLGNYIATKSDPAAWERLLDEVGFFMCRASFQLMYNQEKDLVVETVQSKGLSTDTNIRGTEMEMDLESIHQQFRCGIFKVPCTMLEFHDFDEHLNADIQNSPGRR